MKDGPNSAWTGENDVLTEQIIGCAMEVHRRLGPGYLESVYEKALLIELRLKGLSCQEQCPISVSYREESAGEFVADMVVEGRVIIELKACQSLHLRHEAQLVNHLVATGLDVGLLLNFGSDSLQIKRKNRIYHPRSQSCESCNHVLTNPASGSSMISPSQPCEPCYRVNEEVCL
jgi:GxxExxY protein